MILATPLSPDWAPPAYVYIYIYAKRKRLYLLYYVCILHVSIRRGLSLSLSLSLHIYIYVHICCITALVVKFSTAFNPTGNINCRLLNKMFPRLIQTYAGGAAVWMSRGKLFIMFWSIYYFQLLHYLCLTSRRNTRSIYEIHFML